MRIIRFLSNGKPFTGQATDETYKQAKRIDGDPFRGQYSVTNETLTVDKLLAPIVPTDILCIGLNYKLHAAEGKSEVPKIPMLFIKASNTLNDPGGAIPIPRRSSMIDYEAELVVVIGPKPAKNVSKDRAMDFVFGYTCGNDVSSRDWQKEKSLGGGQFARGKSFDGFCPLGPSIVTKDEVPNPNALAIKSYLNGNVMQDYTTSDMIFDVPTLIESLSSTLTLRPGAVIMTGTPHGVGFARTPPVWMKPGDTIDVELEKIGRLSNPVTSET